MLGKEWDFIPQLYAYFEEGSDKNLVQELIEGHDLRQEIQPGQPWREADVRQLLLGVLEIIACVHDNEVIRGEWRWQNSLIGKLRSDDEGVVNRERGMPVQYNRIDGRSAGSEPELRRSARAIGECRWRNKVMENRGCRGVHLTFARAKHSGIKFVVFCHHFYAQMLRPYRWICKYEMHPVPSAWKPGKGRVQSIKFSADSRYG